MKFLQIVKRYKEIVILFLLSLTFTHKLLFSRNETLGGDITAIYSFFRHFFVESVLKNHSFPLWDPYMYGGLPFAADPSSGMFYPLNLLFFIIPIDLTFSYLFFIDIFLIGVFTYYFAKKINLSNFSALITAIIFMFSGPLVTRAYSGHVFFTDIIVWFPLLLFFYEDILQRKKFISVLLASIPTALMLVAGHTQIAFFGLFTAVLYFLLRVTFEAFSKKSVNVFNKPLFFLSISFLLGCLLASVQLLPSYEITQYSVREKGLSFDFASDFSLHPYQTLSFIFPHFFGDPLTQTFWGKGNFWELCGYAGFLTLLLAGFSFVSKPNKYKTIFVFLSLFTLFFAFGKYSFIFPFFFNYVPFFDTFRAPARFLYVYAFCISILAGFGTEWIVQILKTKKNLFIAKRLLIVLSILLTIFLVLYFKLNFSLFETYVMRNSFAVGINHHTLLSQVKTDLLFAILLLFLFLILLLYTYFKRNISFFKFFLFSLVVLNSFVFGIPYLKTQNIDKVYELPKILKKVTEDKSRFRIFDIGSFLHLTGRNKIETVTGIGGIYLKDYRDFLWLLGPHENTPFESFFSFNEIDHINILSLLNTKYIVTNKKSDLEELIEIDKKNEQIGEKTQTYYVYKNVHMLPRAYIVPNATVIRDSKKTKEILQRKLLNPKETILITKDVKNKKNPETVFQEVEITEYTPNKISLRFKANGNGFLVVSDVWYPGWIAVDNGNEKEILKANYLFRSIPIEKGDHVVEFKYDPQSIRVGKIVSAISIVIILFLIYKNRSSLKSR